MRRAREQTVAGVLAMPPRTARSQSILRTEEPTTMSPTTSAATGGGITADLRNWARGCYSTEAAVELLIRARGGRFLDPGQPWLRTDDRGITWLDAQVIGQYSNAVSSGERHILALVEALALAKALEDVGGLMASLDPYHLDLVLAV
jgi:hypothetical protein